MLAEAAGQAQATNITNVTWAQGSSTDLPGDLGRFRLVTMGRSFHWMDREQVLAVLDDMVDDVGGIVLANDSCLVRPTTAWQQAIEEIQRHFLPPDFVPAGALPGRINAAVDRQSHKEILARSTLPTRASTDLRIPARPWTVEQVIGYLYSTSLPLRRLLGNRRRSVRTSKSPTYCSRSTRKGGSPNQSPWKC